MTDDIPTRGDPMRAFPLPWYMQVEAKWTDCEHGRHPFRASVAWSEYQTDVGCGDTVWAAVRDALARTPIVEND